MDGLEENDIFLCLSTFDILVLRRALFNKYEKGYDSLLNEWY